MEAWAGVVEETRGGGRTREAKTEAEEEMKGSSELELIYSSFSGLRPLKLMAKIGHTEGEQLRITRYDDVMMMRSVL